MKKTFWNNRIPTLLGLFLITVAVVGTTLLVGQKTFFTQEASPSADPQQIRITNVTNSSFTVSYSTASFVPGSLNFGSNSLSQSVIDDKDNGSLVEHKIHSFTVKNLTPLTKYSFTIVSGQNTYENNGSPYQVETGPQIEAKAPTGFLVGKVTSLSGSNPKEAIIYATTQGAAPLSVNMKNDGSYTISFENLRTANLISFFQLKSDSLIKLLILSDEGNSNVQVSAKDIVEVPTVTVSKDYDFTGLNEKTATQSANLQFPTVSGGVSQSGPKITNPSKDQTLSNTQPVFKGTGIPNDTVKILIQSAQEIQGNVVVDSSGNWTFVPSTPLTPGQHTITITAKDSSGILRTLTQTFTILSQTAQAATPSASVSPTPSPSSSVSPSPSPSATPIVIPSATPTPTPIVIARPTPVPTLPPTGSSDISTGFMGIALTILGGFFFILARFLL